MHKTSYNIYFQKECWRAMNFQNISATHAALNVLGSWYVRTEGSYYIAYYVHNAVTCLYYFSFYTVGIILVLSPINLYYI